MQRLNVRREYLEFGAFLVDFAQIHTCILKTIVQYINKTAPNLEKNPKHKRLANQGKENKHVS